MATLVFGVGLVLAAQLEVFTATVTPHPGPEARPGRALLAPETDILTPSSDPAAQSSGPATAVSSSAGRIQNTVGLSAGAAPPTSGDSLPTSTSPTPQVAATGPFLNAIRVVGWVAVPENASPASSAGTQTPGSETQAAYPAAHIEPTVQDVAPARALIAATLYGRGLAPTTTAVGENRALLAARVQGRPQGSLSTPVTEQRTLHTEADSGLPVVQREVQPLVSTTSRRVSYGGLTEPHRGGSMELTASNPAPSSLLSAGMTKRATPLVSSSPRWSNTILVFNGATSPSHVQAEHQAYAVAPHTSAVSGVSQGALSPADAVVEPTGGPSSSRVEGLGLTPTSQSVDPAQNVLPAVLSPGMPAPTQDPVEGVTRTLVGTIWPEEQALLVWNVVATGRNGQATVTWNAPVSDGGSPITGYTVTSSPENRTATVNGSTLTATVTGLTNGVTYTFTVKATNALGQGPGATSNAITLYLLAIVKAGAGLGTVTSNPEGISCGSDCSEAYSAGTEVTLTAAPSGGSQFAGWSGACDGVGPCTLTVDGPLSVTATFVPAPLPVPGTPLPWLVALAGLLGAAVIWMRRESQKASAT